MIKAFLLLTSTTFSLLFATLVVAESSTKTGFTPEQTIQIEKIIRNYLVTHPDVLIEASHSLQKKQQEEMIEQAQAVISKNRDQLFNSENFIIGNAKGDVTVIEFFDYQCNHCKKMFGTLKQLLQTDKNVRVIFKDLPIMGAASEFASQAALAAQIQGKYLEFHEALMVTKPPLNEENILNLAKSIGIDDKKLQKDMKLPSIQKQIETNMQLAQDLHLAGTPALIIGRYPIIHTKAKSFFIPGATSLESLQQLINQARQEKR